MLVAMLRGNPNAFIDGNVNLLRAGAVLDLPRRMAATAYRNGIVFRAFGDNILGFAPALTFTESDFGLMFERLKKTLDDVLAMPEVRAALKD